MVAERFRSHVVEELVSLEGMGICKRDEAKSPGICEIESFIALQFKQGMHMRFLLMVTAQQNASGHAEMDDDRDGFIACRLLEVKEQVFTAPANFTNSLTFDASGKVFRHWNSQVAAKDCYVLNAPALNARFEAPADSFNFWQFRHRPRVAVLRGSGYVAGTNSTKLVPESDVRRGADVSDQTHFGFRNVPVADKESLVGSVFERVAGRYDVMNDLMSLGMHRLWKEAFVSWLNPKPGIRLLDVAGGTGDIAKDVAEHLHAAKLHGGGLKESSISICDINPAMLEAGRDRIDALPDWPEEVLLNWVTGDAESLPVPDRSHSAYTIAFGIRNVTDIEAALRDAFRVLEPGGRFMCLEFSRPVTGALDAVYDRWSFDVIPEIGARIADDREAYVYLVESIRKFPDQEAFADMIRKAGFRRVQYRNLAGGIVAMHSGWRL